MKNLEIDVIELTQKYIESIKNLNNEYPDKDIQCILYKYLSNWTSETQKFGPKALLQNVQMSLEDFEESCDRGDFEACRCHLTYLKDLILGE